MINGNLEQFLDTGWYSECTLFLNGYVYWCEAQSDTSFKTHHFFINRWKAENEDNKYYNSIINSDGEPAEWMCIYEDFDSDIELIKKSFLEAAIFDGKTFWQVETEIAWLEEGDPITDVNMFNTHP